MGAGEQEGREIGTDGHHWAESRDLDLDETSLDETGKDRQDRTGQAREERTGKEIAT